MTPMVIVNLYSTSFLGFETVIVKRNLWSYYCSVFTLNDFSNTRQFPLIKYGEVKDPLLFD